MCIYMLVITTTFIIIYYEIVDCLHSIQQLSHQVRVGPLALTRRPGDDGTPRARMPKIKFATQKAVPNTINNDRRLRNVLLHHVLVPADLGQLFTIYKYI